MSINDDDEQSGTDKGSCISAEGNFKRPNGIQTRLQMAVT